MSISRRRFIKIGGISAALIAGNCFGSGGAAFAQTTRDAIAGGLPAEAYGDRLMSLHLEDFRRLIGSKFSLFAENFAETAVLIEVADNLSDEKSKSRKPNQSSESFMLSFRVSKPEVEQKTYTLIQSDLGQFDLLLVPARNAKGEILLNAIINRL